MAREDEEDENSSTEIPSFEDLVDEIEEQKVGKKTQSGGDTESDTATSSTDPEDTGAASDESDWKWGGADSDDNSGDTQADSSVDALWEGSDSSPDSEPIDQFDASKAEALIEIIDDAPNVLLVGPAGIPMELDICSKLCDAQRSEKRRRLLITTEQTAEERLESLRPYTEDPYDDTTIIVVGNHARSANRSEPSNQQLGEESVVIETLHDPKDLTRLGVLINKYLGSGESPPVICFHTLNGLLQFVGLEKLFRFLHILQARVRSVDGQAHYQIDPEQLESEAVQTLQPLFDFTVKYAEDGSISAESKA